MNNNNGFFSEQGFPKTHNENEASNSNQEIDAPVIKNDNMTQTENTDEIDTLVVSSLKSLPIDDNHNNTNISVNNNINKNVNKNTNINLETAPNIAIQTHTKSGITIDEPYERKSTLADCEPLKLAVVGHTNTGKTSLLRTLLRDTYFGDVKNAAATTRHVERAMITDNQTHQDLVALYDTPGLEDATGVMDWLEENTSSRRDGIDRLQRFLASDYAQADHETDYDYSQEAKVIRQLLGSDMAIYVIDAREPVLGRYKDELTILSWSAIPVMPVFNFGNTDANKISEWQDMLARRGIHMRTTFDSIAFEFDDEMTLWKNLSTMLTDDAVLAQLINRRTEQWANLHDDSTLIIADFLLNIASFVRVIDDGADPLTTLTEMQEAVRQAERAMHQELLNLYKFYDNETTATSLEISEYQRNPFDAELLKSYGIRTSSGAAAGALFGVGIDVATFGASLGLGAALGGLAGGILSNTGKIADMISGTKHLYIDPETLTLLATRSVNLLNTLRHRGHANTNNIIREANLNQAETDKPNTSLLPWSANKLPSLLKKARSKPEWSALTGNNSEQAQTLRKDATWKLSAELSKPLS